MAAFALFAGAILAGATVPAVSAHDSIVAQAPGSQTGDHIDVAYDQLVKGRAEAAISHIRANPAIEAGDPAALINLGTANAMLGRTSDARALYLAAASSDNHYLLELADGRWMDSRRAARLALTRLSQEGTLALR